MRELVELLKKVRNEKIKEEIELIDITNDANLIRDGVLFDDEHTCFYGYNEVEEVVDSILRIANTYGIYLEEQFVGIINVFYANYKDLSKIGISVSLKKEYRNKSIGFCSMIQILNDYFNTNIKSVHLSIREDNIKSRRLAEKCGFVEYVGYRNYDTFTDLDGNEIPQIQYLLTKKEFKKSCF